MFVHSQGIRPATFRAAAAKNAFESIDLPGAFLFVDDDSPCGAPFRAKGAENTFDRVYLDATASPLKENRLLNRVHFARRLGKEVFGCRF